MYTQMPLRIPHTLHKHLKLAASAEGISLNQYCLYLLSHYSPSSDIVRSQKIEKLLLFLEEAHKLKRELRKNRPEISREKSKETPQTRWKKIHEGY